MKKVCFVLLVLILAGLVVAATGPLVKIEAREYSNGTTEMISGYPAPIDTPVLSPGEPTVKPGKMGDK
jgi:hypothetical protein